MSYAYDDALHHCYYNIKHRCYNPKAKYYKDYGGRGIFMCDEWLNSKALFVKWAKEAGHRKGLQIDRVDNDKGYSPKNCRWTTAKENSNNRRERKEGTIRRKIYEYAGQFKTLEEWCNILDLPIKIIYWRLAYKKMTIERAFETPMGMGKSLQKYLV